MNQECADVVVIGGGAMGAAAALHLQLAGVGRVVLLERDHVGQGTTSAGGGFASAWAAGHVPAWKHEELVLERYGISFYRELAEAQGHEFGLKQRGTAWIASSEENRARYLGHFSADHGVEQRELDGAEVEDLTEGFVSREGAAAAIFHPGGIHFSAPRATAALVAEFERSGGVLVTHRPAEGVDVHAGRVTGIRTVHGPIAAECVVVAAGAWTNVLLRELGVWLPMVPLPASRITTEPIGVPEDMPNLVVPEYSYMWLRAEPGGLLCWGLGYEVPPRFAFVEADPPDRLAELALDGILETRRIGREAATMIPSLGRFKSMAVAHGAPVFTADLRAMVGPVAGIDGLWVLGGDNEAGITHGPGYGRLVADLVTRGDSEFVDPEPFRLDRFGEAIRTPADVVERMGEVDGNIWEPAA